VGSEGGAIVNITSISAHASTPLLAYAPGKAAVASLTACLAAVRRRFYELAAAGPAPIASEALQRIAELYRIEDDIRGRSAEQRRAMRQEKSRLIVAELEPWPRKKLGPISQKTKLAEAIRYTLSRWDGLSRFLDDGRIEIASNTVERSIRLIALNRKNALFAGSDGGAKHWAVIASLIETCKLNGVEPLGYLADVLTRIVNGHPTARSTISSRGPTSALPSSGPWPENIAYDSALPVSLGQAPVIPPPPPCL